MIYTDLNTPVNHVVFADEHDVCQFCLDEEVEKQKRPRATIEEEMRGKLDGQKVFILPNYKGERFVVCRDHMEKTWETLK